MSTNIVKWLDPLAVGGPAGLNRSAKSGAIATAIEPAELPENLAFSFNDMLRLVLGGTFVFAGLLKLMDPAAFALYAGNYQVGSPALANWLVLILPWLALTAGLLVLAGIGLRPAALFMAGLTGMIFVVIVAALVHDLNAAGDSFGTVGARHAGLVNLLIATTFLTLAALLARRSKGI